MYRRISAGRGVKGRADATAVGVFEDDRKLPGVYGALDRSMGGALSGAVKRAEFSGKSGTVTSVYPSRGIGRAFLVGLGQRGQFDGNVLRVGGAKLVQSAFAAGVKRLDLRVAASLDGEMKEETVGRALGDGLSIGNFVFEDYHGAAKADVEKKTGATDLRVLGKAGLLKGVEHTLRVGESVSVARAMAATPPNIANPKWVAARCRAIANEVGLRYTVIDAKKAAAMGMGGLTAVGRGGSEKPVLVALEHKPARARGGGMGKGGPVLLVGKAVTFDTGGYSLKPPASMDTMKYDKCGGMAVIGAMRAIASLKLPVHVVGLIPSAENMIDEDAYRPCDILKMYNGVTVEVTNTDAEGRLILADALAYGYETYKPRAVVDVATLTGGVVVALGTRCAGLFCEDEWFRGRVQEAAGDTGERVWQLPLWLEHRELLKGTHSDIVNSGGREAHAIQGAAFLSHFVDDKSPKQLPKTPWAHIDIAGVADVKDPSHPLYPKGPTGFAVRLLTRLLERMA